MAVIFFGMFLDPSILRAGDVYFLDDRPEVHGKLTLNGSTLHVDGGSAPDINLADVLEADFDDADFHLDYFSSRESPDKLPSDLQGQNIGQTDTPGSFTYADGTLTISCSASSPAPSGDPIVGASDRCYFLGQPWTGDDGQWTARIKERGDEAHRVGLMLRTSLDPGAPTFQFSAEAESGGSHGFLSARYKAGTVPSYDSRFVMPVPGWLRLTRRGGYLMSVETSVDGAIWYPTLQNGDMLQNGVKAFSTTVAGIFVTGSSPKVPGKAVLDDIIFTPGPAEPATLPGGVLLRSGSFLAGGFNGLDAKNGDFIRNGRSVPMTTDQVASVIWEPTTLHQLAEVSGQTGLILRNGDFLASDLQSLNSSGAQMSSVAMGIVNYIYTNLLKACVLHPVKPQPSDYEIRLKDGSDIRASGLEVSNGQLVIHEVSGITVPADPGEVAQFRAGLTHVQTLIDLPWKATALAANPSPAASAPPTAPTAPAAVPAPAQAPFLPPLQPLPPLPTVRCWEGNNAEQIMAAEPGTVLDFPLTGKIRALALRVAVLSDTPNAQAIVRILADGREIGRTPAFKAGDQPRFVQVTLQDPKTLTLVADSLFSDTRILYIDPVVIQE